MVKTGTICVESKKIKLLALSPYYAQVNGHVKSNNKNLINLIKNILIKDF